MKHFIIEKNDYESFEHKKLLQMSFHCCYKNDISNLIYFVGCSKSLQDLARGQQCVEAACSLQPATCRQGLGVKPHLTSMALNFTQ